MAEFETYQLAVYLGHDHWVIWADIFPGSTVARLTIQHGEITLGAQFDFSKQAFVGDNHLPFEVGEIKRNSLGLILHDRSIRRGPEEQLARDLKNARLERDDAWARRKALEVELGAATGELARLRHNQVLLEEQLRVHKDLQERVTADRDGIRAKLGQAVVALEALPLRHVKGCFIRAMSGNPEEDKSICVPDCPFAILTDHDNKVAGETWRELGEVYEAAWRLLDAEMTPIFVKFAPLDMAVRKVDMRRGGRR